MIAAEPEKPPPPPAPAAPATFFRQSGWLMIAGIGGGALTWPVHFLAPKIPIAEYGLFGVYMAVTMNIPTMSLQMALAHQTAGALATNRRRELSGMIRFVWQGTLVLWLLAGVAVFLMRHSLMTRWQVTNAAGLWVTAAVVLFQLWGPMFTGVLQGRQDFLWMGWTQILNGAGRLGGAALAVLALGGYATGMMSGVLAGLVLAAVIAAWHTRDLWTPSPLPFDWRSLVRELIPPMLGFGAFQFLFTADTMFVKSYFTGEETAFYFSAGTLSRAMMWLVGPLAAVMFPRIVQSAAKKEKTDLMKVVFVGTAVLAVCGAIGLAVLGPWVVKLVYGAKYVEAATAVLPWYGGAMVPLALGNVLLNNLLARSRFGIVPPLCLLVIGYGLALTQFHGSLVTVLKTLAVFNLLFLALSAWFTWGKKTDDKLDAAELTAV